MDYVRRVRTVLGKVLSLGELIDQAVKTLVGSGIDEIQYNRREGLKNETRSLILVVVTLIAAVTFQAGINPPGGLWQDNQNGVNGHVAGSAIFAYRKQAAYYVFLFFNTLAFTTSTFIIFVFTQGFPFHSGIRLAIVSISVTYACAVAVVTPPESANLAYVLLLALLPIVAYLIRLLYRIVTKTENDERGPGNTERPPENAQRDPQ